MRRHGSGKFSDQFRGAGVIERPLHQEAGHGSSAIGKFDQAGIGVGDADVTCLVVDLVTLRARLSSGAPAARPGHALILREAVLVTEVAITSRNKSRLRRRAAHHCQPMRWLD